MEYYWWDAGINLGVSVNGGTPIAGWFVRENPTRNGWFGGTPWLRKIPSAAWAEGIYVFFLVFTPLFKNGNMMMNHMMNHWIVGGFPLTIFRSHVDLVIIMEIVDGKTVWYGVSKFRKMVSITYCCTSYTIRYFKVRYVPFVVVESRFSVGWCRKIVELRYFPLPSLGLMNSTQGDAPVSYIDRIEPIVIYEHKQSTTKLAIGSLIWRCSVKLSGWWFGTFFIFPYIDIYWVANHPNWLSCFSEGWPNHQPVIWLVVSNMV